MTNQMTPFLMLLAEHAIDNVPDTPWNLENYWVKDNLSRLPQEVKDHMFEEWMAGCSDLTGDCDAYIYMLDCNQWPAPWVGYRVVTRGPLKALYYALALMDTNDQNLGKFFLVSTKELDVEAFSVDIVNSFDCYKLGRDTLLSFNAWFKAHYVK